MKKILLFSGLLALFFSACQSDPSKNSAAAESTFASPVLLAGHWIDLDFCSRANQYGSVLGAMNNAHQPYAYAISFDPNKPDSAICHNGFETWALPVKFKNDTLELSGARPGKSVFLVYHSQGDKSMTMFDGTSGPMKMDKFIKSGANARDGLTAFTTALNHNLFSGIFIPVGSKDTLQLTPGGFILNWKDYDRFSVCAAGDCFVAEDAIDVITLSKSKVEGSERMFGFRYNGANDTLRMYHLENTNPNEKGAYAVRNVAYTFFRKPAER
ncbi:MAG: hypothetical protein JNK89_00220 [Saprospiraceae bacterium]|nr:hypothetical protein [Saprospiraceae bacterium]